ncbi:MAG: cbpA [Pedosphaera sp.]|nr:cbpA [Pedosphaera sp.]
MKDYYVILGVSRKATPKQIKTAYRALCKKYHPDVNPNQEANNKIQEVNEAYDVLSDPKSKELYDRDFAQEQDSRQQSGAPKPPEHNFSCEKCGREDASLRITVLWKVWGFWSYSQKEPKQFVLCSRCRVKKSLLYNAYTVTLGWWSIFGFFWTLESLWLNAHGGEQPKENNAHLLHALAYQLYRKGKHKDAYLAAQESENLKHDPYMVLLREHFKRQAGELTQKIFWRRLGTLELDPMYYHVPAGILLICLVRLVFR